ncbi:MAG: EI24 domain-containing protein [Bdellovibrionaceae bacterium]|nr:EI24 domain-containing protein [Bdellovibrionales bacterium]MCB9085283.1 EI24 domain-containing protein [Pseudobdellovibrionaceae bacterium]
MIPVRRTARGFSFLTEGLRLIRDNPDLRKWAVVPFVIDLILVVAGFLGGSALLPGWVAAGVGWVIPATTGWIFSVFYYPVLFFFWLVFLIVWVYLIYLLASVVAAPFNAILAERTLMKIGMIAERPFNMAKWTATSVKMMVTALIKAGVFLILGIFIFALSFVPVLNVLSSYLALMVMSFDSMDYSYEILELNLRERLKVFKQVFPEANGMAGAFAVTLLLPGLTLLAMPAAVVGGASILSSVPNLGRKSW